MTIPYTYVPNIWTILQNARRYEEISERESEHLKSLPGTMDFYVRRDRLISLLEKRTGFDWRICEGYGYIFPADQMVYTINDDGPYGPQYTRDHLVWAEGFRTNGYCPAGEVYQTRSGDYITQRLYSDSYCTCEECGDVVHQDDAYWRNETLYCDHCDPGESDEDEDGDDEGNYHTTIHSYGTRIESVLNMSLKPDVRYFGIELEQEFPGSDRTAECRWARNEIPALKDMSIWKHDGSLDNGAELVSLPKPLGYWQRPNPVQELCDNPEWRKVARSHKTKTCGLHVHVSRNTIPETVIAKIVYLMNEPCMADTIALIARRAVSSTYCFAQKKKWHSDINPLDTTGWDNTTGLYVEIPAWKRVRETKNVTKRQVMQGGRYTPVNLTPKTIEFRIFRGTLKWQTVLASIEFCDAVISYCTQFGAGKMNDKDFCEWLRTSITRKTYPALRDYLAERTLRAKPKPKPSTEQDKAEDNPTTGRIVHEGLTPYEGPYGSVERHPFLAPGHSGRRHFPNENGGIFYEDGYHWEIQAEHLAATNHGVVPIVMLNGDRIQVPLAPGFGWWSDNRASSLIVI